MKKLSDVRKSFLDYFEGKGHTVVKSANVIPENDKTLLFTNAGMVPFKDVFLGKENREYKTAVSSQKCIRAGGKHNDLDNVGYTARHLTFFEMLGNFSFGDYFKEKAITYAWDLLTNVWGLDKNRLLATVYHTDDEAYDLWKKISGLPDDRILRIATKDNFWEMGDTGPCGPCSEIFYDKGENVWGGKPGTPDEDGDRWIEIWNNVFMQNETLENGEVINLAKQNIDTGMGLERMTAVFQDKLSNFEIDLFMDLKSNFSEILKEKITDENVFSFNILADHLRSVSFALCDGASFSNMGQGYVIRRILRRALRHIYNLKNGNLDSAIFYKGYDGLIDLMGQAYPELNHKKDYIKNSIKLEEELFIKTLGNGMQVLDKEISSIEQGGILKGDVAFRLYDTYGFPVDLTEDILKAKDITIDKDGFEMAEKNHKEKSKAGAKKNIGTLNEAVWFDLKEKNGKTEFLGYSDCVCDAKVLYVNDNKVVLDKTVFYAESGGQISDIGTLSFDGKKINVLDVQKLVDGLFVHFVDDTCSLKVGQNVCAKIDVERRERIKSAHTTAHLLQSALIKVLGNHILQKGSKVSPDRLHFDFSHGSALTDEEKIKVEDLVNKFIDEKIDVDVEELPIEDARKKGAIAPFGEKYGDVVRVIKAGEISCECCGGTHIENTGKIGCAIFVKDESVSAGVRRISFELQKLESGKSAVETVQTLREEKAKYQAELEEKQRQEKEKAKAEAAAKQGQAKSEILSSLENDVINGVNFVYKQSSGINGRDLKNIVDAVKVKFDNKKTVVLLVNDDDGRVSIVLGATSDLVDRFNCGNLIKEVSIILGGKGGGGRDDMAQAGGSDVSKMSEAIGFIKNKIEYIL